MKEYSEEDFCKLFEELGLNQDKEKEDKDLKLYKSIRSEINLLLNTKEEIINILFLIFNSNPITNSDNPVSNQKLHELLVASNSSLNIYKELNNFNDVGNEIFMSALIDMNIKEEQFLDLGRFFNNVNEIFRKHIMNRTRRW